jgi:hypothetical protein
VSTPPGGVMCHCRYARGPRARPWPPATRKPRRTVTPSDRIRVHAHDPRHAARPRTPPTPPLELQALGGSPTVSRTASLAVSHRLCVSRCVSLAVSPTVSSAVSLSPSLTVSVSPAFSLAVSPTVSPNVSPSPPLSHGVTREASSAVRTPPGPTLAPSSLAPSSLPPSSLAPSSRETSPPTSGPRPLGVSTGVSSPSPDQDEFENMIARLGDGPQVCLLPPSLPPSLRAAGFSHGAFYQADRGGVVTVSETRS